MVSQEQIENIKTRISELEGFLSIPDKKSFVEEQELQAQDSNFWDDPKKAEQHLKNINKQKVWVTSTTRIIHY
jgi:peptide chain release factor 2